MVTHRRALKFTLIEIVLIKDRKEQTENPNDGWLHNFVTDRVQIN